MDVLIKFDDLSTLNDYLKTIVTEFDSAEDRADVLEDRWDDKRDELRDGIKKVQEHVQGVIDGFTDWDVETAASMSQG